MPEFDGRPEYAERIINTSKGKRKLFLSPYGANGATLVISNQHSLNVGEENWNYMDWRVAFKAMSIWHPDRESEPDGWVRNVRTGRYRPGGHACKEYVKWQGTAEEQVGHALAVSLPGSSLLSSNEVSSLVIEPFPTGTLCFSCTLQPDDCTCGYCFICCCVFQYLDRCILISMQEMILETVTIEQAVERLIHGLNGESL